MKFRDVKFQKKVQDKVNREGKKRKKKKGETTDVFPDVL